MSWIFGVVARDLTPEFVSSLFSIHDPPLYQTTTSNLYIAGGGLASTCSFETESTETPWIVTGCGIWYGNGRSVQLSPSDWRAILASHRPDVRSLDGHFVAVTWNGSTVRCINDLFGMRTMYAVSFGGRTAFSTRLDWLAKLKGGVEIDFPAFGGHWLTFNALAHESLVKGVHRMGPNSRATFDPGSITIEDKLWEPDLSPQDPERLNEILMALLRFQPREERRMSFGLSGGLDSRLLLALLVSMGMRDYSLHLLGHEDEPDVRVAKRIGENLRLKQEWLFEPIPSIDECIRRMRSYVAQTHLVAPATAFLKLGQYARIHNRGMFMVDGGMGEIARRQFLTRLRVRGKAAVEAGDPIAITEQTSYERAPIFCEEVMREMRKGIDERISNSWKSMPSLRTIGLENFLDLLVVRYRFPNYGGIEQSRTDGEVLGFTPFAQPSYVRAAFGLPAYLKRNARLYRSLIRVHCPALTHYPLVKGTITYPFRFQTVPALIWTKAKAMIGMEFVDPTPVDVLERVREYVLDLVHSKEVREYAAYDYPAVANAITLFYAGRRELAGFVEWWLAFELWRSVMKGTRICG